MDFPAPVGRRTEDDFLASGNLCRSRQHQYGREEWSRTSRHIQSHAFDGDRFLPAGDTGEGLDFLAFELLGAVKGPDVVQGQQDGRLQFDADCLLGFFKLFLADCQRLQSDAVELLLVCLYRIVALSADFFQYGGYAFFQ